MGQQPWKRGLTKEQEVIVGEYREGPIKVEAIPGSGKTRVVCALASELWNRHPSIKRKPKIRLITFTRKAAGEARERLVNWVGDRASSSVTTFHSLAFKIYNDDADSSWIWPKNCVPCDGLDKKLVIQMLEQRYGHTDYTWEDVKEYWNLVVHESASIEELEETLELSDSALACLVLDCLEVHRLRKELPLDLWCPLAVSLLRKRRKGLVEFLIVDEFQDTDMAQFHFAMELVKPYRNLIVVGDLHQSIYRWRGAKPENMTTNLDEFFPEVKSFPLTLNFRSTPEILKAGASILPTYYGEEFPHEAFRKSKQIKIDLFLPVDTIAEAEVLVQWIFDKTKKGYKYEDIIVLYRNHSVSIYMERLLIENQIPYKMLHRGQFLGRKEVQDLLCYMKWSLVPEDRASAKRIINRPKRRIGTKKFLTLETNYTKTRTGEWTKEAEPLRKLLVVLNRNITKEEPVEVHDWLYMLLHDTGLWSVYRKDEDRLESFQTIMSWAGFADKDDKTPIEFYTDLITSVQEDDDQRKSDNKVQLMTIHAAKGLESPCVFVSHGVEGILPGNRSDLQEECHLAYVAVTRAEDYLAIGMPDSVLKYGSFQPASSSRFFLPIFEMGENVTIRNTM